MRLAGIACSILLLTTLLVACGRRGEAPAAASNLDDGRRIYRDGLLPDGQPLTAIVAGDVPILGTQFSCESCHGRSGMGAGEATYVVPPIAGPFLFAESPQPRRPAYDLASLEQLLRDGVTPSGRSLDRLMPRYRLSDDNVAALAAYLAALSADNSPGVDDEKIHFGTVITADADPAQREAILAVLNQFFAEKNRQTRNDSGRWDRGYTPESKLPTVFREWVLDEWTLDGPSEDWGDQLERHYAETPIFAMVSGLGNGSWGPVGEFCERHEIPCLLPTTNWPDAEDGEFYTVFYSRGLALEANLIATHLRDNPVERVVQVSCNPTETRAADALAASLAEIGIAEKRLPIECGKALPATELAAATGSGENAAVVLWLRSAQLDAPDEALPATRMYVSSTLLDGDLPAALAGAPGPVYMAHPFRLPGGPDPAMLRFKVWAKTRGVELTAARSQAEAFFACRVVNDAILHMGRFFIRDYLLDMLDHTQAMVAYLPFYPRPTLGPGQRFLNKGGYMLPVVDGKPDTAAAVWIAP